MEYFESSLDYRYFRKISLKCIYKTIGLLCRIQLNKNFIEVELSKLGVIYSVPRKEEFSGGRV